MYPGFLDAHYYVVAVVRITAVADLYSYVDRLYKMYIAFSTHVLFYFPFVLRVSSILRYFSCTIRVLPVIIKYLFVRLAD